MTVKFVDFGKQYLPIKDQVLKEIDRVLTAGELILQKDGAQFEQNLAELVGTKYAVGVNSGTDALFLALKGIGIGALTEVAVPSHTFAATAQVVQQAGADIALYDLDGQITLSYRTEAIMVAHMAGELSPIPLLGNLPVIEDACQALGAVKNPTTKAQCWSFYPAKILGAYGDGGALTTNDQGLYERVKDLRNHCKSDYSKWGINSRLDNLQAAVLNVKLKYLPQVLARRQEIAQRYLEGLKDAVVLPNNTPGRVWQDFIIRTDKRDQLYEYLKTQGVETMKNDYPMPCGKLPQAREYEARTLRLPCNETLNDQEVEYVIQSVINFF